MLRGQVAGKTKSILTLLVGPLRSPEEVMRLFTKYHFLYLHHTDDEALGVCSPVDFHHHAS
jgi:hypothetical protein